MVRAGLEGGEVGKILSVCQRSQGKRPGREQPPFFSLYRNQESWRPWLPESLKHPPPQKPGERGSARRCRSSESLGKKRSIHVVNGTLFSLVTGEREKGNHPFRFRGKKGMPMGERNLLQLSGKRKKKIHRASRPYRKGNGLSCPPCVEGVGWWRLKGGSLNFREAV